MSKKRSQPILKKLFIVFRAMKTAEIVFNVDRDDSYGEFYGSNNKH